MSNRTLIELNHDFCPRDYTVLDWGVQMQRYMSSGDPKYLPYGVTFLGMRHHSDPEFKLATLESIERVARWISVEERLPEYTERNTYQTVLVWDADWQVVYMAWREDDGHWEPTSEREQGKITHWMPIPDSPAIIRGELGGGT